MELEKVVLLLLSTVEMSQELFIGFFLILLNRKKKNALLYLGLFLLVSGLASISEIFDVFNIYLKNTYLNLLPFNFYWLAPSLLYIYVERVSVLKKNKLSYLLLIPGTIEFVINTVIFILVPDRKYEIEQSNIYLIFELLGILYGLVIIVLILIKVQKHSKKLKNQYSSLEHRELKWVSQMIIFFFLFVVFIIFISIIPFFSEFSEDLISSIFGILMTYWTAYNGLLQQVSANLLKPVVREKVIVNVTTVEKETPINSKTITEKYEQVLLKIKSVIKEDSLYLKPELTIVHIAEKIDEHPRLISTTINTLCRENFNSYINRYRVENAKKMLLSDKVNQLNIEGIGLESGFKSNSTFYNAFKKFTNSTPLQFVKKSELH